MVARVLLKARPTPAQLADRLRRPLPEGLELYLDVADISGPDWLERLAAALRDHLVPAEFAWVVEGPLRSLDGAYFDLGREAEADREVMRRIVACARRIGAPAVVIHCIALATSAQELTWENRRRTVDVAERNLTYYAGLCAEKGLVPTIENVPPVARMRESAYTYPLIGMPAADIAYFCDRVPGLRATCDTSHAQLFLNAAQADPTSLPDELAVVARFAHELCAPADLNAYIEEIGARLYEAHISNATGLLGEGMPYDEGVADLDQAVSRLLRWVEYLVTEPLEPFPDRAERMREVARRIIAVRQRVAAGGTS